MFWAAFFVIMIPLSAYLAVGRSLNFVKLMPDDLVTVPLTYDLKSKELLPAAWPHGHVSGIAGYRI